MKARHAKKLLVNLLRTHITVVPKDCALLIHLPLEAVDYAKQWGQRLAEVSELLGVRIAAVMGEVKVTVVKLDDDLSARGVADGQDLDTCKPA